MDWFLYDIGLHHERVNYGKTEKELMKEEALSICRPFKWSGFFRVLALSSVRLCFVL